MQLLDPDDLKMSLLNKSSRLKGELEQDVKNISERTEKVIINTIIIGGTLAATYFLVRQFSGSKSKNKNKVRKKKIVSDSVLDDEEDQAQESSIPGIASQIGGTLVSQASSLLLTLAKEKLVEYFEAQAEKKNHDNA